MTSVLYRVLRYLIRLIIRKPPFATPPRLDTRSWDGMQSIDIVENPPSRLRTLLIPVEGVHSLKFFHKRSRELENSLVPSLFSIRGCSRILVDSVQK